MGGFGGGLCMPPMQPVAPPPAPEGLPSIFRAFCGSHPDMDGKSFVKLCKDSKLVGGRLSATDADLIFARSVAKGRRRMTYQEFLGALEAVAEKKPMDLAELYAAIGQLDGPVRSGTRLEAVRFYDDKSTFTGTHRAVLEGAGSRPVTPQGRRASC